jgi:uncharacterized protein YndB with AHSA1/START domain
MADILHEVFVDAPPESVYRALTEQTELARWWTDDVKAEPREGSVARFGFGNGATVFNMHIDDLKPNRRVKWTCHSDTSPEWEGTHLDWELEPGGDGSTTVRFTHADWPSTDGQYSQCNTVWGALMWRLKAAAEGQPMGPFFAQ